MNMLINLIKLISYCLLLLGGLQQCKPQIEFPINLNGMLLYVEDLDGVGGSASGNFSDLVAFDPDNKLQYIMTSDRYYDQYPTYSPKSNKVYFESKRENFHPSVGLTAQSHIYVLDLSTTKMNLVDTHKLRKSLSLKKWGELNKPAINNQGTDILFQNYKNKFAQFVLYNFSTDTYSSLFDSSYFSFRCVFSEDDSNIVFASQTNTKLMPRTKYLGIINVHTGEIRKFLQVKDIEFDLGDYKYDKLVFIGNVWNQPEKAKLYTFDTLKSEHNEIADVSELGFNEIKYPVFKNKDYIYFIGSKESIKADTFDEDIYLMNLNTKEIEQITFTHNIKDNLRYYE
jgi:Tol biopolymer transport system component